MSLLLILIAAALATGIEDVKKAADPNLGEPERMAAFERAAAVGNASEIIQLAVDGNADSRHRWVAIRVLGRVNSPLAVEALLKLLSDDQPAMRAAAVSALGDTRRPEVVEKIAAKLSDPAVIVRAASADALGQIGDPRAVPYLDRALSDPTNSYRGTSLWVRRHYIEALSSIGSRSALDAISRYLADADPAVSGAAISAMEKAAGFSYASGRTVQEQQAAWQRWWANQR